MTGIAPVDLTVESEVANLIDQACKTYGGFDILYNNASAARFAPIESLSLDDWNYTLANELTLIYLAIKHAIPVFRRRGGGVIINTASIAGVLKSPGMFDIPGGILHVVTKAGVIALTNCAAIELSPLHIRVNSISPGTVDTPGLTPLVHGPARAVLEKMSLTEEILEPEEIASAALFLASDEARQITGANLVVDGGVAASGGAGRPGSRSRRSWKGSPSTSSSISRSASRRDQRIGTSTTTGAWYV